MDDDRPLERDRRRDGEDDSPSGDAPPADWRSWSNLWQVPTILLSLALIALAVRYAMLRAPVDEFDLALNKAEELLAERMLDEAGELLRYTLEPHIENAEPLEQARFHAAVADYSFLLQREQRVDLRENNHRIDRNYAAAVELGLSLEPARLERWTATLISLGHINEARNRLRELEMLDVGRGASEMRSRRIALFHRLIDRALHMPDVPADQVLHWLQEYRADRRTDTPEQLWAIARQARVRLNQGEIRRSIDQLLIDMRRMEYALEPGEEADFAELYTLLGRAYHMLGQDVQAGQYLEQALEILDVDLRRTDPVRGEALVITGRIAVADGNFDLAFERFDTVLREFVDTRSYLPALLGRAEVSSILGSHDEALADYRRLADLMREAGPRRDLSPRRVGASLIDRHDAALAMGQLETALRYVMIAERLFPSTGGSSGVPTDVLYRIATTSRQFAANLLAEAGGLEMADVPTVHRSNLMHQQAADYYVKHARAVAGLPGQDDKWADSLFNAADCYDLAGLHELAIRHFEEYLAGRSVADPRRGDVTFRLAQCHHALLQFESAAHFYEQVIREHPRSVVATRSHVPLARCYLALGRMTEAQQQLRQVLAGLHPVQPDAADFRDALIELGTIYYNDGRYAAAIEHLDEAVQRYPDDERHTTVLFRLADSYRSLAMEMAERIREPSAESPGERRRLDSLRRQHLRQAMELFDRVCHSYTHDEAQRLAELETDLLRASFIHRADCAFHLGEYERAILLYDEAARRYSEHHSSMHALIQIVNCYATLGDTDRAAAAHRRALVRLQQLRDEAFEAPDALMDRQAWERWLENTPLVPTRTAGVTTG